MYNQGGRIRTGTEGRPGLTQIGFTYDPVDNLLVLRHHRKDQPPLVELARRGSAEEFKILEHYANVSISHSHIACPLELGALP